MLRPAAVNVLSTNATGPLAINTGSELDAINIGNSGTVGTPGLLTPIAGAITVDGGTSGASLTVDGSGAGVNADYAITSTTFTRSLPLGFGGVSYSSLSSLLLTVGAGANVVTAISTSAGCPTTVNTNAVSDTVSVLSTNATGPLTINTGSEVDVINIGNNGTPGSPGLLTPIAGAITVDGGADGSGLLVDGSGAAVAANYAITDTTVTRSTPAGFGGVTYSNLSTLLLTVGSGANVVDVLNTAVPTAVFTNAGIDTVNVTKTSAAGPLTTDTGSELDIVNIGNTGTVGSPGLLTPIAGAVNVTGGANGVNLTVDGSGAGVAADYAITSTSVSRITPSGFGGVTYSNLTSLLLTVGSGANVVGVGSTAAGVVTNIATGAGDDSIVFANGVSLNGGTVDGGANTDTIDYSLYSTPVAVNLGANATGGAFTANLNGFQENPGVVSAATGVFTSTYNNITGQLTVTGTVNNLFNTISDAHIHRAAVGVNGGVIVPIGAAALVPTVTPGQFTINVVLTIPAQHAAAFLGGLTYFNIHTTTFPGGEIRGQIFPDNVFVAAAGAATGTGGISNIENATGGSGNDSLVGDNNANVLNGGSGNDTIVGARGNDTMNGDANNDDLVWSNGDNNDIIDGGADTDNVSVNGAVTAGDIFTIGNGAPGRVAFARTNLVLFNLDIGTTETLTVNGIGGDDLTTVNGLNTVTNLTALRLNGFAGSDTFNVIPDANVTITAHGYDPVSPSLPGDTLTIDAQNNSITSTATVAPIPVSTVTVSGRAPVNFLSIETPTVTNVTSIVVNGTGANDTLTLRKDLGGNTIYVLNGGAPVNINSATSFAFNGSTGNDTFTVDYFNGSPMPTGGVIYNGGENVGDNDRIVVTGYTAVGTVTVTHTGPESGTVQVGTGNPLIAFNETEPLALGGTAVNLIINLPAAGSTALLTDDGTLANGVLRLLSSPIAFEATDFTAPTGSLTINRGNAADTLNPNNLSDFNAAASLAIGSAGNNFQSVSFGGPATVSALSVFGGVINNNAVTKLNVAGLASFTTGGVGGNIVDLGTNLGDTVNFGNVTVANRLGFVNIFEDSSMSVNTVSGTNVTLNSTGAIGDNNGLTNNITATNQIASAAGAIDLDTNVGTLTASTSAAGNIDISEADRLTLTSVVATAGNVIVGSTTGNITVGTVTASGNVNLSALGGTTGSIVDDNNDATRITGGIVTLQAQSDIGRQLNGTQFEDIDTTAASIVATTSAAPASPIAPDTLVGIWIDELDGVTLTQVSTIDGLVRVTTGGSTLANIVLAIGTSRNITIITSVGDLTLNAADSNAGNITLQATAGSILSGNLASPNAIAASGIVSLTALNGIGASGNAFEFSSLNITTNTSSGSGNQFLTTNATAVSAADMNAGAGTINLVGGRFNTLPSQDILSNVIVQTGATLGGTGNASVPPNPAGGTVTVNAGGTLAPGLSPGIVNAGNLSISGFFDVDIFEPLVPVAPLAGTNYDQTNVTGTVTLNAGATLNLITTGSLSLVPSGSVMTIINNDGGDLVSGTFSGLPEGSLVVGGANIFKISYNSFGAPGGNDVQLKALALTIDANDTPPQEGATNGQFSVFLTDSLSGMPVPSVGNTVVNYTVTGPAGSTTSQALPSAAAGGSFDNPNDYQTLSGVVTILNGNTEGLINVIVFDDSTTEVTANERVEITLTKINGLALPAPFQPTFG